MGKSRQYLLVVGLAVTNGIRTKQQAPPARTLFSNGVDCEIVRSYINWRGKRNISYKSVETSS